MLKNLSFIFLFLLLLLGQTPIAYSQDSCSECGNRKLMSCGDECALVPAERVKDCQKMCVFQYCSHKCADSSELDSVFHQECEGCKEQQFALCGTKCDLKSEYKKANCQIECATSRCKSSCQ